MSMKMEDGVMGSLNYIKENRGPLLVDGSWLECRNGQQPKEAAQCNPCEMRLGKGKIQCQLSLPRF